MDQIDEQLQEAIKCHQNGDLDKAEPIYMKMLEAQPDNLDALFLLGTLSFQKLDFGKAVSLLNKALVISPESAEIYNNLGNVYREQGITDKAIACYLNALTLKQDFAEAHNNLGVAWTNSGKFAAAGASFKKAVHICPEYSEAYNNLGNAYLEQGMFDQAVPCFQKAITVKLDYMEAHYNLGIAFYEQGRYDEAIARYEHAIELNPKYAEVYNNLGVVLNVKGRVEEAITNFERAVSIKPNHVDAYYNLGNAFWAIGKHDDAIKSYGKALEFDPDHTEARWNMALVLLLTGNYKKGWAEYEVRFDRKKPPPRNFEQPKWDGSPLEGKTILIHAEQGFGDTFQFARFLPLVKAKGGNVIFKCQKELSPLLKNCKGFDSIIESLDNGACPVKFDTHMPLLSLPGQLQIELDNLPAEIPYIFADPELENEWQTKLQHDNAFKVGIVWSGNQTFAYQIDRECSLADFEPLSQITGVALFSLQKGAGAGQALNPLDGMKIKNLDKDIKNFSDTAAIINNLDLVISVDTAVAHLAGALGKPVWALIPYAGDWRWMLDREDSPWYPGMRLFRQKTSGNWKTVISRVTGELEKLVAQNSPQA